MNLSRYNIKVFTKANDKSLLRAAYRAKLEKRQKDFTIPHFPNYLRTLGQVAEFLDEHPGAFTYKVKEDDVINKHHLKTVTLKAAGHDKTGDTTILWYDEEIMKKLTNVDLSGDGTYASRPRIDMKKSSQFLTLMGKVNGKVSQNLFKVNGAKLSKLSTFYSPRFNLMFNLNSKCQQRRFSPLFTN